MPLRAKNNDKYKKPETVTAESGRIKIKGFSRERKQLPNNIRQYSIIHIKAKLMKRSLLVGILLLFIYPLTLCAQSDVTVHINATLNGTIIDSTTRNPISGATVQIEGTTHSVITDNQGKFEFVTGQSFPFILKISSVGYHALQTEVKENKITIELKQDLNQLNDIVVVGYTSQERKNLIGAISQIDPAQTKRIPTGNFVAQLQGAVPGVQITSADGGVPGEQSAVRIRGANSINLNDDPLYIVDGVFINSNSLQTQNTNGSSTSPLADINPSDIESIQVLKDAEATALYGSRGANGVVIVTTKRGNYNQLPKINVDITHGWSKAAKLWKLATGPQSAELINQYYENIGSLPPFRALSDQPNVSPAPRGLPEDQKTYDRLDQIFRTAQLQNYSINVTGGSQNTKYYIGSGYDREESILQPIAFNRANLEVNLDQKIGKSVRIGISNNISRTYRNEARAGDGPSGGLLQAALHTPTFLSPYNDAGQPVGRAGFDNVTLLIDNYDQHATNLHYIGNFYLDISITHDLKFHSSWSADYNNNNESEYWNTYLIAGSPNGSATAANTQSTTWINEQTLTYQKEISDHSFGVLFGNTIESDEITGTSQTGKGFSNNSFTMISSAATTTASDSWSKKNLASFFARVNYGYKDKYLADFSIRADGSSGFGAANHWGYFPSVGAAWRIKDENFLKNVDAINDLKLRVSYGVTGNQNGLSSSASLGLWNSSSSYMGNPGIAPQQLANPNLQWERTGQFNIGLTTAFLNDRLNIEGDYYNKKTSDDLMSVPLAATTGFGSYESNAAEISNKGFELNIKSDNIKTSHFTWSSSFNIAQNKNNIDKLASPIEYGSRNLILQQQGHPLYSFWVYKQLYVDPQTGNTVYDDVNKDGKITVADRQIDGSVWPKFFGGLTNTFTLGNFSLDFLFSYQFGNKEYNENEFFGDAGGARDQARVIFANNLAIWKKPGDITNIPKADGVNVNNYLDGGSLWLESGSFVRLRTLTLSYTLPKTVTTRLKIQNARLYISGANLLLFTKYDGLDPESSSGTGQNQPGIDLGTPPTPRSIQIGLNLTL